MSWPAVWVNTRGSLGITKGIAKAMYNIIAPVLFGVLAALPFHVSAQSIVYPAQLICTVGQPANFVPVSSGVMPYGTYVDSELGGATQLATGIHGIAVDSTGNWYVGHSVHETGHYFYFFGQKMHIGDEYFTFVAQNANATNGVTYPGAVQVAIDASGNLYVADGTSSTIHVFQQGAGNPAEIGSGFSKPTAVAIDKAGNVYVGDSGNHAIYKLNGAGPPICWAADLRLGSIQQMAVDATGNIYVAAGSTTYKIAGRGAALVDLSAGGPAVGGSGVAIDINGNLYFNAGPAIRKRSPNGKDSIINIDPNVSADVLDLAVDGKGEIFYNTTANSTRILQPRGGYHLVPNNPLPAGLRLDPVTGAISGTPTEVTDQAVYTISTDGNSIVYADVLITVNPAAPTLSYPTALKFFQGEAIQPVYASGARLSPSQYFTPPEMDGSGFNNPTGVVRDHLGNIYVSDFGTNSVKEIPLGGNIVTVATNLNGPRGLAVDAANNVYVADWGNNAVKKIFAGGAGISTIGSGFSSPYDVAVDQSGNVYVADLGNGAVKKIPAGGGSVVSVGSGFVNPNGVAVDGNGNVYVTDLGLTSVTVLPGVNGPQRYIGSGGLQNAAAISVNSVGDVYVVTANGRLYRIDPNNNRTEVNVNGTYDFQKPVALFADYSILIADQLNTSIDELYPNAGYYVSPQLPAGLVFSSDFGYITGTPTTTSPNNTYTAIGWNVTGGGTAHFTLRVDLPPPTISYTGPNNYLVGTAITPLVPNSSGMGLPGYAPPTTVGTGFNLPAGVAGDANGNLFVTDAGSNTVKEILYNSGTVMTVGAGYQNPHGIAADASGNLYIADYGNNAIDVLRLSGINYSAAGTIGSGFLNPAGVAVDRAGNIYVADYGNNAVKKIPQGGGVPVTLGSGFLKPSGVAVDGAGNVYVADLGNKAVKMIPAGGGAAVTLSSGLSSPTGITIDASGNILVADAGANTILKIPPGGGTPTTLLSGFSGPSGILVDALGNICIADQQNNAVKKVVPTGGYFANTFLPAGLTLDNSTGTISGTPLMPVQAKNYYITGYNSYYPTTAPVNIATFSPAPAISYSSPLNYLVGAPVTTLAPVNTGAAVSAPAYNTSTTFAGSGFSYPMGVAIDAAGNLYVADNLHFKVQKVPAGGGANITLGSGFQNPVGVAVDGVGNVYVADQDFTTIKRITGGVGAIVDIGSGFNKPWGVAVDAAGNVYVGDSGNNAVKEVPAVGGAPVTLGSGFSNPLGLAADAAGNVYVADAGNNAVKEIPAGGGAVITIGSGFNQPSGVAIDGGGNLFIADEGNGVVKAIFAGQTTPVVIGSGFSAPTGVAADRFGGVYVADQQRSAIIKITPSGGFYVSPALPAGLSLNGATGNITGTPTALAPAADYKITGYNASAASTATTNITVLSASLQLTSLTISNGTLRGAFTSGINTYTDTLVNTSTPLTFTPTALDPAATITINGVTVASGTASPQLKFSGATSVESVTLSLPGTSQTNTYSVQVTALPPTLSYTSANNWPLAAAITPLQPISTWVGPAGYAGVSYQLKATTSQPHGIAVDTSGNLYIGHTGSTITRVAAGGGSPLAYGSGFSSPLAVCTDAAGNVYVADYGNNAIKKIPVGGGTPVTLGSGFSGPNGVAIDAAGNVYVGDRNNNAVKEILAAGGTTVTVAGGFNSPGAVAVDALGNIYVVDSGNNSIKMIPAGGGAPVSIGTGFSNPTALAVDASGNLFIADTGNARTVEIPAGGGSQVVIATALAGTFGVAVDQFGAVYMSTISGATYKLRPSGGYYLSAPLPPGLSFNNNTGVISGTPKAAGAAANYRITAYNPGGGITAGTNIAITQSAYLSALQLSAGSLSPSFAPTTTTYGANVGSTTASITLTPAVADPTAAITVNGVSVASGAVSAPVSLTTGLNTITIVVTGSGSAGSTTYTVLVTRGPSVSAYLASLAISKTTLSPAFAYKTLIYSSTVPNTATSVTVTPALLDATATATVNGVTVANKTASAPVMLAIGANIVQVVVTAQDGITQQTYTDTLVRLPSSNDALKSLKLNAGSLSPIFDATTLNYSVSVANNIDTIAVTPTVADGTAHLHIGGVEAASGVPFGGIALAEGATTVIPVLVTAQDGTTTQTYTVTVTRATSTNANLSALGQSAGGLTPAFLSGTTSYTENVSNTITTITLKPVSSDANATIKVNGTSVTSGIMTAPIALAEGGQTVIATVVTAQDGTTTKTYTVTVTRAPSTNANLSTMGQSAGGVTPAFSSGTTSYSDNVTNATATITLKPVSGDANATIKVNGTTVTSGTMTAPIALSTGPNVIITVVTAQDGTTTKTYTLTVTRAVSANASLSALKLSNGTLTPAFATATTGYTATVANTISTITVTPTTADPNATIRVNSTAVISGTASGPITLAEGANTVISVVITAQNGTTKETYTVTVARAPSTNANLSTLGQSVGGLTPGFSSTTTSYTDNVSNATATMTLKPVSSDANATITVNGITTASGTVTSPIALAVGPNTITTIVTAQNGTTTKTYTLTVTRAASGADGYIPITIGTGISVTKPIEAPTLDDDVIVVHQGVSHWRMC